MRPRSSSNLPVDSPPNPSTFNPKCRNRRRSKQPFILEESPVDTMVDQRTMAELLRAPTEGYAEAIVVPPILAEQFELKRSLINMMTSDQFFGLEKHNPHDHIRWFNKITSTIKYKDVPNSGIKLMLFPFSLAWAACRWLEKEPPRSILTWEDLVSKFINEFFPPQEQQISVTKFQTFNNADIDSLNSVAGGNLLERRTQDVLTIIENKSKVRNSRNKLVVSQVKSSYVNSNSSSEIAKLTHAVNQQTSAMTTAMTAILKQFQATPPPASVKAVEEICVSCGGAHPYYQCLATDGNTFPELRDNIQGYVSAAAVNYNQGNFGYRPLGVANQIRPLGFAQPNVQNNQNRFSQPQGYNRGNNFNQDQPYQAPTQQNQVVPLGELEKIKRVNKANMKAMQTQINNVKNELRNEMKNSIQASMSNQTNELKNMMASFFQMNTASTSGGIVLDGPSVPIPPPFINPEEDERVEETLTDQDLAEYTIKVPPPLVQKSKLPSQRNFVELHINITLADALILIPKYQKMLKALLFNKEKLLKLANTPLNENCSAVILKKLPEKLGDPGKFFIPYGFSERKCKSLADLGASINLMPLSFWKKLGLPKLISTRMTLKLTNRAICTPAGIIRDVFVAVGKFTFPADFVIVDYESDPRVPLILGRPFLRTARALINVHGEEMILRDGDERLTLSMRHDTSSYSNQPQKEPINMINICDDSSEDFLKELCARNHQSGNLTFPSHPKLTSPEVKDDVFDPEGGNIFLCLNSKLLSFIRKRRIVAVPLLILITLFPKPRVYVPNVMTTHPTLMFDSDFIPSDNSSPEFETFYFDIKEKNSGSATIHADISNPILECFKFDFKPNPGELTSIVDFGIRENVLSTINVNLPPKEDHSPLFAYVVWIFLFFLMYPVIPTNLLSLGNEDTIFNLGIANYHFPPLLSDVSHRCETFMKFNIFLKFLNESPMEILSSSCSPMEQ
nr:hypothetical protein [Tanacetum cinerariifolium]